MNEPNGVETSDHVRKKAARRVKSSSIDPLAAPVALLPSAGAAAVTTSGASSGPHREKRNHLSSVSDVVAQSDHVMESKVHVSHIGLRRSKVTLLDMRRNYPQLFDAVLALPYKVVTFSEFGISLTPRAFRGLKKNPDWWRNWNTRRETFGKNIRPVAAIPPLVRQIVDLVALLKHFTPYDALLDGLRPNVPLKDETSSRLKSVDPRDVDYLVKVKHMTQEEAIKQVKAMMDLDHPDRAPVEGTRP